MCEPRYHRRVDAPRVFALNVHANYACRHSGACCTAGWTIPVEPHVRQVVDREWLLPENGACPQYNRAARRCDIHRSHGEAMLPESCFQFPRRALIDSRGTFVTLSHFCPTAASLLLDDERPLEIVANPTAFPAARRYEGLDGRGEWPPLVRPDLLFDHSAYDSWERFLVETLGSSRHTVDATLGRLAGAAERLRAWTPDLGPLEEWTTAVVGSTSSCTMPAFYAPYSRADAFTIAAACVPEGLDAPTMPDALDDADADLVAPAWDAMAPLVLRYIAAKAFASWSAYQARGVRTHMAELLVSTAVLRVECVRACQRVGRRLDRQALHDAVRAADWLLVHLVDRPLLMTALGEVERHGRPGVPR